MQKFSLFACFAALFLFACGDSDTASKQTTATPRSAQNYTVAGLQLREDANPAWKFRNLRLYPIVADPATQQVEGVVLPELTTLSEAMTLPGFRITERKKFGRSPDAWYNALTVQNKTQEAVFLMSGDVVTGGNQDRVIAHDDVLLPGTLKNIAVFCVEHGRSEYYDPNASESEKQVAAFRGYYSVASPQVRQAVHSGDQQGVWDAVATVTSANDAESGTHAYVGLEKENAKKDLRNAYLQFFEGKFADLPNVMGVLAVCNGKVVGIDIYGRSDLFQRQFTALLHGYATEAAATDNSSDPGEANVAYAFHDVASLASSGRSTNEYAGKFDWEGRWVHLYMK